ncbi:polysaccharide biosynthesis tyrosine autokinase [Klebsiella pneumoniae]|uniref:Tyrosine autokinase n=2 Tax=Klebsiella pneumoniae TaxID=573 RepID=A0A193SEK3_KLEPN|nr:polysaccharide biosynthesis tyrosine autokinase [Klebsiella pneumoniae]HBQ5691899.1 polysaccharide biosynthesis tyrosine autokinase [Klebsiella pneumoniae subsp. pneumoniae]AXO56928.1 tyrosine-protein kinase [Klebsiella pneumoniae]EIV9514857.1 polysaccharide biosynthesis tyrosine autokinase [Klebsiella pneumoniae]EIX9112408.1 polysaccharide biosynthesis tyrosine autokinase [Klebsiella pneumoniae]EIX9409027.1 polysaccharide biosynthesis tyrosine autokinase [Klebsiella pneumoniae]
MSLLNEKKTPTIDNGDLTLGRLLAEIVDNKKLIIAITSLFTFIALSYAILATPIYQADALVQVEQKQGNAILNSLSQMLPNSDPQSEPEIALLQSRMILGKTVDDLNLQVVVEKKYFPIFGRGFSRLFGEDKANIKISKMYAPRIDGRDPEFTLTAGKQNEYLLSDGERTYKGKVGEILQHDNITLLVDEIDAEPGTDFDIVYQTKLSAVTNLQNTFNVVDKGKNSGMLALSVTGDNPVLITNIINSISQNYLAQNIERQAAQDAKSLDFLNAQLPKVRTELNEAEDKLNNYRKQKDSVDLSLEAKSVLDQIVNVDNQLNNLTFREAEISQLYTKEHPTYKALIEKKKTLEKDKGMLNKKVSAMPSTQQEVLRLSRDVESGRAVYMQLLNRQQELNIAKSSAIGNVRIIDTGVTEPTPIKPKKIIVIIIGLVLGGVLSVIFVLCKALLRKGIESAEQLETIGLSVYASVPASEWLLKKSNQTQRVKGLRKQQAHAASLLALDNPADLAVESIRGLRTSLHFAMMEASNNIIMISGASPNAGKTFVSSNLSAVIAQTGQKVLYIDADMRKGYVHKTFGLSESKGLSDILSGQFEIKECIKKFQKGGFDFISRGQIPPNPAELLMSERWTNFIDLISPEYDLIIIDTPPILAVTDAAIIGRNVGTTLLVLKHEDNTISEAEAAINRFNINGVHVKGAILNGIVRRAVYSYSYGYYSYEYSDKKNK